MNTPKILAAAVAAATFSLAFAQGTPPAPATDPAVGAGQRSTQNTPMGTTGTPGGATGAAAQGSTAGSAAATDAGSTGASSSGNTAGSTSSTPMATDTPTTGTKAKATKADRN